MFTLLLKGEALKKQQSLLEPRHGLELWRQLHQEHEPKVKSRFGGMLSQLLQTKFAGVAIGEFDQYEKVIKDYEDQSGEAVTDNMRCGIVSANMDNEALRQHLRLHASSLDTFAKIKDMIISWHLANRNWSDDMTGR